MAASSSLLFPRIYLLSSPTRCSRVILCFTCPSSGVDYFSKELWFLLLEKEFRKQNLGISVCSWLLGSIFFPQVLSADRTGNICSHLHTLTYISVFLYASVSVYASVCVCVCVNEFTLIPQTLIQCRTRVHFRNVPLCLCVTSSTVSPEKPGLIIYSMFTYLFN